MKYFEFGAGNRELMVMLHGGGVSYRGVLPTAEEMAKVYHVVLVAYDGFNPDEPETEFKSPMDEAGRLGDYITEHYGGKIDILYGISYGCRVLMEVLRDERLTITTTIADGMSLRDYPNIRSRWGKDVYCFFFTGLFYAIMGRPGPRRKKFLAKITGRELQEAERILYGKATWKSWKNQDYFLIGKKTVWYQRERGQKTVRKPAGAETEGLSLRGKDFHRSWAWRAGGRASAAVFAGSTGGAQAFAGRRYGRCCLRRSEKEAIPPCCSFTQWA